MKLAQGLILSVCALLAGCAAGRPSPKPDPNRPTLAAFPLAILAGDGVAFIEMDGNRDRVTDTVELDAWVASTWSALYADRPRIGAVEFQGLQVALFGSPNNGAQFEFMWFDKDLDQVVTREDFTREMRRRFTEHDRNKDGRLTRGELYVNMPRPDSMRPPSGMPRRPPGGGMPPGGPGGGGPPGGGGRFPG